MNVVSKGRILKYKFLKRFRNVISFVNLHKRRLQYSFVITLMFICFGYSVEAIATKNYDSFDFIKTIVSEIIGIIISNIIPLSIVFGLLGIITMTLIKPKVMRKIISITIIPIIFIIFFVPKEIFENCILKVSDFILFLEKYIFKYSKVSITILGIIVFLILIFKRTRKKFFKVSKYLSKILTFAILSYYFGFHKNFNIIDFVSDYWHAFKTAVRYLQPLTDGSILVYLVIVIFLIYFSIFRGIKFHIRENKKNKSMLYDDRFIKKDFKDNTIAILKDEYLPKIGVCIPAFNEELTIVKTVNSVLASNYPISKNEILVISDGSTDRTVEVLKNTYNMNKLSREHYIPVYDNIYCNQIKEVYGSNEYPNLKVIVKDNGGKFDALNVGLQYFEEDIEYLSFIDADTTLDSTAFRIFATEAIKNPEAIAFTGTILPRDEFKTLEFKNIFLTIWQTFDYLSSFHLSRGGLSYINGMMIISGAFGFFKRRSVLLVNGYKPSLGEDIFLTLELQQQNKDSKINYIPQAVAYTQVPINLKILRKQRMRWFKGLTESLGEFKKIWIKNPRMRIAFAEFSIVEWVTPILFPYGLFILLARPEMMSNLLFQISMGIAIITPMIQSIISFFIETTYRPIKLWKLLLVPFSIIMSPLTILWRNDGLLDFSSKTWGKMNRS